MPRLSTTTGSSRGSRAASAIPSPVPDRIELIDEPPEVLAADRRHALDQVGGRDAACLEVLGEGIDGNVGLPHGADVLLDQESRLHLAARDLDVGAVLAPHAVVHGV